MFHYSGSSHPSTFGNSICGYELTIDNWQHNNKIEVKATIDNIRDGDHRITLEIIANVYSFAVGTQIATNAKPNTVSAGTVQVNGITTNGLL